MSCRPFVALGLSLLLLGCAAEREKQKKKEETEKKHAQAEKQSEDPAFLAFVGRLRTAVAKKDLTTLSSMMTANFGYRWDTPPVGDNVFTYWDLNESWPVLSKVLRDKFVPLEVEAHETYMVAPAAFANDATYQGFRAGMRIDKGSWKFAYFVPREDVIPQ